MNKKIIVGLIAIIVIVGGASMLSTKDGVKGRFYNPGERGRGAAPQAYSSAAISSYPASSSGLAGTVLSAEALPVNDPITRVELADLIFRTLDSKIPGAAVKTTGCFKDSKLTQYKNPGENLTGEYALCMLASKNIITGDKDGNIKPFAYVNRAEVAKIFRAVFDPLAPTVPPSLNGYYADVKNADWFYQSVAWLVNAKVADIVSSPKNNFFPNQYLSHGRTLYWIANVKKNIPKEKWVKK